MIEGPEIGILGTELAVEAQGIGDQEKDGLIHVTNDLENDGKDLEGVGQGQGLDQGHGNNTHHQGQGHTLQGHLLGHPVPDQGQGHLDPAQDPNLGLLNGHQSNVTDVIVYHQSPVILKVTDLGIEGTRAQHHTVNTGHLLSHRQSRYLLQLVKVPV